MLQKVGNNILPYKIGTNCGKFSEKGHYDQMQKDLIQYKH